jgi:hypothetical protein
MDYNSMDYNFVLMLSDDFLVRRPTLTPDGSGGFNKVYSVGNWIKGRLDGETDRLLLAAGADIDLTKFILFVAPGTDILKGDHITGLNRTMNVLWYETIYENQPWEVHCVFAKPLEQNQ